MGSTLLAARREHFAFLRDALHAHDTLYAYAATRSDALALTGRGVTYSIGTPYGRWVVRRYRRGGAVAKFLGDRYLRSGRLRPIDELWTSTAARAAGVRTPEVIAACVYASGMFYRGDLVTAYVAESADLAALGFGGTDWSAAEQESAWHAAGQLIRDLEARSLAHADLNLKNVLIQLHAGAAQAWVLDLDRARIGRASAPAMYARLQRSLRKWERNSGRSLGGAQRAALEAGYRG